MSCYHVWEPVKPKSVKIVALKDTKFVNESELDFTIGNLHYILKNCKKCGDMMWFCQEIMDMEKAGKSYKLKLKGLFDKWDIAWFVVTLGFLIYFILVGFVF